MKQYIISFIVSIICSILVYSGLKWLQVSQYNLGYWTGYINVFSYTITYIYINRHKL